MSLWRMYILLKWFGVWLVGFVLLYAIVTKLWEFFGVSTKLWELLS